MKIQAPAKLNLTLEVKDRRDDGYHLLESDVVFLNLCDELELEPSDKLELNSDIEDNIILKAARVLDANRGVKITLKKNIPMGAGLGGGSADAAATLFALSKMWNLNLPEKRLYEIALSLGADVPVCLFGHLNKVSTAHFGGIGEIVTDASPRPEWYYLLVNPNKHLATKDVFQNLNGRNDLVLSATELMPEIAEILEILKATKNNLFARMSGTGATCFAVYESLTDAAAATNEISEKYWKFIASQHSY
jgi:4-diphosphocytidyl-2-C-methyl-D-erythritol kinase